MLKINGAVQPAPLPYTVGMMDLQIDAQRLASGLMVGEIVATKVKLELEWGLLTGEEISGILQSIKSQYFEVEYFDAETNSSYTRTFYKGDRNMGIATVKNGFVTWKGFKVNFIER